VAISCGNLPICYIVPGDRHGLRPRDDTAVGCVRALCESPLRVDTAGKWGYTNVTAEMGVKRVFFAYERLQGRGGHEVGRALLARLYREATGEAHPEILRTPLGKPYFADSAWHFSISHTKNHAFCALSDRPVGIDAEETDRQLNPALAQRYLSENEQARLHTPDGLLRLWVLKEAAAKCCGKGIGNWLKNTDFDPFDPRISIIDGCYVAILEEYHAV